MGRTQRGNNNAYCQDNLTTWVDWDLLEKNKELYEFIKNMIKLRKKYPIFQSTSYLECDDTRNGDIILHGTKLNQPDLSYHSLSIAFELLDKKNNTNFYIALNSYYNDLIFELPELQNEKWHRVVDTSCKESFKTVLEEINEKSYVVKARSSIILIRKQKQII